MLYRIITLTFLFAGLSVHADAPDLIETCEISSMTLEKETQIHCATGDLVIAPGTVIDTNGFFFQVVSDAGMVLGTGAGFTIDSRGKAGIISIYARNSVSGRLNIRNESATDGMGESIDLTVGAFAEDYEQAISNGLYGCPTIIAGGEELLCEGPENNIARN